MIGASLSDDSRARSRRPTLNLAGSRRGLAHIAPAAAAKAIIDRQPRVASTWFDAKGRSNNGGIALYNF
jgi:hypothetical protein